GKFLSPLIWMSLGALRKLLEESKVVFEEQSNVRDLMTEDRDAFDADAPGEARVPLRVVADGLEDRRMDHAASTQLDPAGLLAHRASASAALPAAHVELCARLGVREEACAEPHSRGRREHLARERQQRALEVRHRDAFAHDEPLDLSERGGVREIEIVATVDASRR